MRMNMKQAMTRARLNAHAYGGVWQVWVHRTEDDKTLYIKQATDGNLLVPKESLLCYDTKDDV